MDFCFTKEQERLRQDVRNFVKKELPANWDELAMDFLYSEYGTDETWEITRQVSKKLASRGWLTMDWPKQYDSLIGEMACRISEGQKQRIALARAVIKRPKLLLLDEAMSSMDSETEDKITDKIKNEFRNSTVIIVSHRLSTVRKMDLVYFLEQPGKIDIATHQELLSRNRRYRELFASQITNSSLDKILFGVG